LMVNLPVLQAVNSMLGDLGGKAEIRAALNDDYGRPKGVMSTLEKAYNYVRNDLNQLVVGFAGTGCWCSCMLAAAITTVLAKPFVTGYCYDTSLDDKQRYPYTITLRSGPADTASFALAMFRSANWSAATVFTVEQNRNTELKQALAAEIAITDVSFAPILTTAWYLPLPNVSKNCDFLQEILPAVRTADSRILLSPDQIGVELISMCFDSFSLPEYQWLHDFYESQFHTFEGHLALSISTESNDPNWKTTLATGYVSFLVNFNWGVRDWDEQYPFLVDDDYHLKQYSDRLPRFHDYPVFEYTYPQFEANLSLIFQVLLTTQAATSTHGIPGCSTRTPNFVAPTSACLLGLRRGPYRMARTPQTRR